jgi:CrcB protein
VRRNRPRTGEHRDLSDQVDSNLPVDPDVAVPLGSNDSRVIRGEVDILFAILVGGFFGTLSRYLVSSQWTIGASSFPLPIFLVNLSGSFAIGLVLTTIIENLPPTRLLRPFACIGFLGGWTTMSTLAVAADQLISAGHLLTAISYALATAVITPLAATAGILTAHRLRYSGKSERGVGQ